MALLLISCRSVQKMCWCGSRKSNKSCWVLTHSNRKYLHKCRRSSVEANPFQFFANRLNFRSHDIRSLISCALQVDNPNFSVKPGEAIRSKKTHNISVAFESGSPPGTVTAGKLTLSCVRSAGMDTTSWVFYLKGVVPEHNLPWVLPIQFFPFSLPFERFPLSFRNLNVWQTYSVWGRGMWMLFLRRLSHAFTRVFNKVWSSLFSSNL